jgi:mercuric ion transport protein
LGAAIGLGFLSQYEGLFIILLPLFAGSRLLERAGLGSVIGSGTQALGMIGPIVFAGSVSGLLGWQSGEPALCRPGLDGWGVGLGFRL